MPTPTSIMIILLLFCWTLTYLARLVYETLVATSESAFIFETSIFVPRSIVLSKFSIIESRRPRSSSFNWSVWSLNPTGLLSKNSCSREPINFLWLSDTYHFLPQRARKGLKLVLLSILNLSLRVIAQQALLRVLKEGERWFPFVLLISHAKYWDSILVNVVEEVVVELESLHGVRGDAFHQLQSYILEIAWIASVIGENYGFALVLCYESIINRHVFPTKNFSLINSQYLL